MSYLDIDESELDEFKIESAEMLDEAEECLLSLEGGARLSSCYDAIFRSFHSLKGAAGMLGIEALQNHMHELESCFASYKEANDLPREITNYLLKGVDLARNILDGQDVQLPLEQPVIGQDPNPSPEEPTSENTDQSPPASTSHIQETSEEHDYLGLVYIAEDDDDLREIIETYILNAGFRVASFPSAEQLLNAMYAKKPHLIISDIKMDKMDGLKLLEEVKKEDTELPVILLSGYITKQKLIEAIDHGVYAAIEKPFKENELLAHVINATQKYQTMKLLNQSINFVLFQYSDLDNFLKEQGKEDLRQSIHNELKNLLDSKRKLKELTKKGTR